MSQWTVASVCGTQYICAPDRLVAKIAGHSNPNDLELMAHAPDLLEALKSLTDAVDYGEPTHYEAMIKARAVISSVASVCECRKAAAK